MVSTTYLYHKAHKHIQSKLLRERYQTLTNQYFTQKNKIKQTNRGVQHICFMSCYLRFPVEINQ